MSFKLEYPYTEEQKLEFIVEYNHKLGLRIETVENIVEVETSHYEPNYGDDGEIIEEYLVTNTITENYPTYYALEANEILVNGEVQIDPDYEEKEAKKEAERISMLSLTGADVERGIYKAKGMDFEDIIAYVSQLQPEGLDIKALKIELKANNFYRGNPYVDAVGNLLGFSKEQLDGFFKTNDYTKLLVENEEELQTNEIALPQEPVEVQDETL